MTVEFYHPHSAGIKEDDLVYIDGQCRTYDKLTANEIETIFRLLQTVDYIRAYMMLIFKRGIKTHVEIVRHAARKFFPILDYVYDIDNDGNVHVETP